MNDIRSISLLQFVCIDDENFDIDSVDSPSYIPKVGEKIPHYSSLEEDNVYTIIEVTDVKCKLQEFMRTNMIVEVYFKVVEKSDDKTTKAGTK